ncbi:Nuclear transport factor 2 (NTF2) domain [Trypanosoma vivax]|nr:Nuclear transport factor 2 (NTF2) domain [Trypanosoma vivax]
MSVVVERHCRVGASFSRQYYTLLVENPEKLTDFYTPNASFQHSGIKATGLQEIAAVVGRLYPMLPGALVKIDSLSSSLADNGNIEISIKGSITVPPTFVQSFTHEVVLMEHKKRPGSFGIVRDQREKSSRVDPQKRWASETPPMFAQDSPEEGVPPMEMLTPAVVSCDGPTTRQEKGLPLSNAKLAPDNSNVTLKDCKPSEESAGVGGSSTKAPSQEVRVPKSFAEAVLMRKPSEGAPNRIPVVVKASKEQKVGELKPAAEAGQGTKGAGNFVLDKSLGAAKKSQKNFVPREAEKKGVKITGGHVGGTGDGKEGASKRRDADGRVLSRFVVFYDIIVKGLPAEATEKEVREIIEPTAPVKLVKVQSQKDKRDPTITRTFAFVQLDHEALKEAGNEVKPVVAKVLEVNRGRKGPGGVRIQVDEVREKYTAAPDSGAPAGVRSEAVAEVNA